MAFKKGHKKYGGRKKGVKNRATVEQENFFAEWTQKNLFGDTKEAIEYRKSVYRRLLSGKAQHIEKYIWEKRFGKEPLKLDLDGVVRVAVEYEEDWRDLGAEG